MHSRAFASIAIVSPRSRYAIVEMDLYGLGAGGLDRYAGREMLRIVLEQPLKAGSIFSILAVVYIPFMQSIFQTKPLTSESWALVLGVGLLVVVAAEVMKRVLPGLR